MKRVATLLATGLLFCATLFAQTIQVRGRVSDDKGAVSDATVQERGTSNSVKADLNGMFTISVKANAVLVVTAVGHQPLEVAATAQFMNVGLTVQGGELSEVVVTALGIKRRPKEMGYANTTVKADQITVGQSPRLGQALAGKVAGLTVYNTSNAVNSSPRIVLRGNRSITGDNTALIVLDGVTVPSNTLNYLNPNDIESVTVLKGGQAATLFGPEGVNGALVITTKKGAGRPSVQISNSTNFEAVSYLPAYQTGFGSGSGYGYTQQENYRPYENQQYGDAYDGSMRRAGRVLPDGSYQEYPYQFIPGIRKALWQTGVTNQSDISVTGGGPDSKFYFSFQDANIKGIVPKDWYRRDAIRFNATRTYGKVTAAFDATYTFDRADRTTADFYFYSLNTPGWIPIDKLKDWQNNPFANPNGYFNDYYNNPWFELDNRRNTNKNNYFNGIFTLNFKPTKWLDFNYRLGAATTNSFSKSWINRFDYSDFAKGLLTQKPNVADPNYNDYTYLWRARNSPITGSVSDGASYGARLNSDFIVTMSKDFGNLSTKLILGNNIQDRSSKSVSVGSASVIIPDLFNVSNRSGELSGGESNSTQRRIGNYADLTLGWKEMLFLHGSVRDDISSVFYSPKRDKKLYNFIYYGTDLSFIVTEALPSLKSNALSFLKLRGGFNLNGNENLGPYSLVPTFSTGSGYPYGGNVGVTVDNTFPDPSLKPEFVYSYEGGFEAAFWNNRVNVDVSYFYQDVKNQVFNVAISSATGYTSTLLNAGRVKNSGYEAEVKANVIKKRNWGLELSGNYTYNTNQVTQLYGGLTQIQLNGTGSTSYIFAAVGSAFPLLKTTYYKVDASGRTEIDPSDGWPLLASDLKTQGITIPKHQLGLGFRANYKFITLTANAEYRTGNSIYNALGMDMAFTGSGASTARYGRVPFIWPNSVYNDGSKMVPNNNIAVNNYIACYEGWGDYGFSRGILYNGDWFTTNGAFWKLRDISLNFNIPVKVLGNQRTVKALNVSGFGRNLFMLLPKENIYTDPEFSNTNGNGVGINTTGNTPPVRQYGVNVTVTF